MTEAEALALEAAVREVYNHCPPTLTHYSTEGRQLYEQTWSDFLASMGLPRDMFAGRTLLDVGCGSCEKASFYHDWGARVTGIDMTEEVLQHARSVIGDRTVRLIEGSLFTSHLPETFDIVVSDGVLHHTADTLAGIRWCLNHLNPGGILMIGLVNVWGSFWWFGLARATTRALGGRDFHRRAQWGQRLFSAWRGRQENTRGTFFRSSESWAYDWFANPRWTLHSPGELRRWLHVLGLEHLGSVPNIGKKEPIPGFGARVIRALTGTGPRFMELYWLATRRPNMMYVCVRKPATVPHG